MIAGLAALREILTGALVEHEATACELPLRPWESGVKRARILPDLNQPASKSRQLIGRKVPVYRSS